MANYGTYERACEDFDRRYEKDHILEIAFDRGRIDWDNINSQNAIPVTIAATVWLFCRILELSVWWKRR